MSKDHTGAVRGFHWFSQAWYGKQAAPRNDFTDEIMVGLYYPEGGTSGEFAFEWVDVDGDNTPQLRAFDDSWSALAQFGDLLTALVEHDNKNIPPAQLATLLAGLGIVDMTKRAR